MTESIVLSFEFKFAGSSGAKMSTEELRAAMRSAEDETDAAAATAAEKETAEELAEFTAEPAPGGDNEDEEGEPGDQKYFSAFQNSAGCNKCRSHHCLRCTYVLLLFAYLSKIDIQLSMDSLSTIDL